MDSDEEKSSSRFRREADMEQLRSGSSSPSTLSIASSGSPLVRGHSKGATGGSAKRPAPTSIAAAQLQCQQQQQQGMALKPGAASALAATPTKSATSASSSKGLGSADSGKPKRPDDTNKSFGYNVAKSIAYRAYR